MPLFKYRVSDKSGAVSELLIEGESKPDSMNRVRGRGFIPLEFIGQVDSYAAGSRSFSLMSDFDANDFTVRLVPLLKAHIHLEKALGIIVEGTENPRQKQIISDLRRGLHEGKKFSALVRDQGSRFPSIYPVLVEAGEEAGKLPEVMEELQKFLSAKKEMQDFLLTSSIYPAIVLCVTGGVIFMLFTVFVPKFSKIFIEMGKPLPLPTKIMLETGNFAASFWWLSLVALGGLIFFIFKLKQNGLTRRWFDAKILRLPLAGNMLKMIEISRYVRTLAIMVKNHVHLLNSVSIASRVLLNRSISESVAGISGELRGGTKLSAALSGSPFFPKNLIRMLSIGEESGNVGEMLEHIADQYENELRIKLKRMLALFEPAVILLLSLVVLAVVISIFMAIMEMNQV